MSTPLDLLRRHLAAADAGDFDADEALFDPGVQTITPGGALHGWKEFRAMNEMLLAAATQPHHEIVRSFTDGDTAIIEGVFAARHTGPMPTPDGELRRPATPCPSRSPASSRSATAAACPTTSTSTTWRCWAS